MSSGVKTKEKKHPSMTNYIIGFALSIFLTLLAFEITKWHLVTRHIIPPHEIIIPILLALALIQLVVQLIFFLHLREEKKPRWKLFFFISTFGLVLLVVIGSIWIMNNLNYRMGSEDMTDYVIKDEGIEVKGLNYSHNADD